MDRLQKKCFVAATGFHLLLLVILVVGPAFLSSKSKVDDSPILDVIPGKLIDAAFSGGGNPHGTPPPPTPPEPRPPAIVPPAPPPEPQPAPQPEPPKEEVKEVKAAKPDPEALEPAPDQKRKKPQVTTTPITRPQDAAKPPKVAQHDLVFRQRRAAPGRRAAARSGHDWRDGAQHR